MAFPKFLRAGSAAALALLVAGCGDDSTGPVLCVNIVDYAINQTATGDLAVGDCELTDRSFVDFYELQVTAQQSVRFDLSSGSFDPFVFILQGPGFDSPLAAAEGDTLTGNSSLRILLAPEVYVIGANSFFGGQTGSYALSSVLVSDRAELCAEFWLTLGVSTLQSIEDTDCDFDGVRTSDEYFVVVGEGASITIEMQSNQVDSYLYLYDSNNRLVAENDDFGVGVDARIVYNASREDRFVIVATTFDPDTTGDYLLTVD